MSQHSTHPTRDGVPTPVVDIATRMAQYGAPWALCGGWAVDAWLGRITRDHADVDISVFVQDQRELFRHLNGWQMLAHGVVDLGTGDWWDGSDLQHPGHIHARPPERRGALPADGIANVEDGFWLDIQLDSRDGDQWVLSREPRVTIPLQQAVRMSPWGVPTTVPEALLFLKSRELRRRDKQDFEALLPHLDAAQLAWLHDAVGRTGHPWFAQLEQRVGTA